MHHTSKPTLPAPLLAALLAACAPLPEDAATGAAPVILCGAASPPSASCAPVCDATCGACPPGALPNGFACDPSPSDPVHALGDRFVLPHPRGLPPRPSELWRTEWYSNLGAGAGEPDLTHWPPYEPGW